MKIQYAGKVFFWGALISFLGSLPLGTLNVTATNIAVEQGTYQGNMFAIGAIIIETICILIALAAMDWIRRQQKVFIVFEWLTTVLVLALAVASFVAAWKMKSLGGNALSSYHVSAFVLGVILSALNPLHIPFWIGWTTILIDKNILQPGKKTYTMYLAGITLGTAVGFAVFIYGGTYLVKQLNNQQHIVNWVIGGILLLTAGIQLYRLKNKRIEKLPALNVSPA